MIHALLAGLAITLLSVIGAFVFSKTTKKSLPNNILLPLAVGVFLSVVFFELIPEAIEESGILGSTAIAVGFMAFYLLSKLLNTFHHHHEDCHDEHETKNAGAMVLVGDSIHNFADGIVIGTAFLVNPAVGIATTLGIALHEIPQEIAEFGILLRAGYSKNKAVLLNLVSASSIVVGILVTFFFIEYFESLIGLLIGVAAGNLLYIAASDLLPQSHSKEKGTSALWKTFGITTAGLVLMSLLFVVSHNYFE